ncbi:CRISPR-associated endonuclease Cas1 [Caldithrix abyssi]
MSIVIISEQGSRLTRQGRSLILLKDGQKKWMHPLSNVEKIFLLGRIEFSSALTGVLLRENIDVIFLTVDGRYKGRLCGAMSKNIFIRKKQYERLEDRAFKLQFSKALVAGKCRNQARLINRAASDEDSEIQEKLQNLLRSLQAAQDLYTVRGLEGSFSALHFKEFRALLKYRMGFEKRIKHPPPDPINILLSLGYTMLFNNVYAMVEGHGLDPYAGYFHEPDYGHPALVSDLMEEFRAVIVDRLTLNVVNRQQVKEEDFVTEDGVCRLSKRGLENFLEAYRKLIMKKQKFKDEQLNYLQIIHKQVLQFRQFLEGRRATYEAFRD